MILTYGRSEAEVPASHRDRLPRGSLRTVLLNEAFVIAWIRGELGRVGGRGTELKSAQGEDQ